MDAGDAPGPSFPSVRLSDAQPRSWFAHPSPKSHVLYVSPEWARDRGRAFDADFLIRQLAECGVDCIELYAKDHHGNLYFPTDSAPDYGRDIVGETLAACRRYGVRFIAYASVCFDERTAALNPKWQATDAVGRSRVTGPFRWLCLRSPYRDLMLGQIEALARGYDIDGLWLDILPLAWPGPYTTTAAGSGARLWMLHDLVPCYCPACQAQFDAEAGRALPQPDDPDGSIEMFEFGIRGVRAFLHEARGVLARFRPSALLTYNGSGAPGDAVDGGDLVSIEGHAPYYGRQGLIARWARGRSRPFEVLTAGALPTSPSGWNGFDRKPAGIIELEQAVTQIHGGSTVVGHAPYPNGRSDSAQFDGLREAARGFAARHRADGLQNVADVLLGALIKPFDAPRLAGRMLEGVEWWNDTLRGGHFLYDIGSLDRELSGYRLIVLADQLAMSDSEIGAIRDYVRAGGSLIATGGTSTFDGYGRPRADHTLADVFGASVQGPTGTAFTYITRVQPELADGLPGTPIVVGREALRLTLTDGRAILRTSDPEQPFSERSTLLWGYPPPDERFERPLGVKHDFGLGYSLYIGVGLDGEAPAAGPWGTGGLEAVWARRLAENLARSLVSDPLLQTDAPPCVEVVLAAGRDRWVLHLVNHAAGDPRYLATSGQGMNLSPFHVSVDATRIAAQRCTATDGRVLDLERSSGRLAITIDRLGIAQDVVLWPTERGRA